MEGKSKKRIYRSAHILYLRMTEIGVTSKGDLQTCRYVQFENVANHKQWIKQHVPDAMDSTCK